MAIHTIPVPKGWSTEQAWEALRRGDTLPHTSSSDLALRRGDTLPDTIQSWTNVEVDENENLVHIFDTDDK
jgi:hypothetical protein